MLRFRLLWGDRPCFVSRRKTMAQVIQGTKETSPGICLPVCRMSRAQLIGLRFGSPFAAAPRVFSWDETPSAGRILAVHLTVAPSQLTEEHLPLPLVYDGLSTLAATHKVTPPPPAASGAVAPGSPRHWEQLCRMVECRVIHPPPSSSPVTLPPT